MMRNNYEDKKVHLEISHSVGSIAFLSHVPVHVLEPVHPPLELDQVGGVGLHSQVDRGLGLVDDDGEPVLGQGGDITEDSGPEQRMTVRRSVRLMSRRSFFREIFLKRRRGIF